ncbi:PREDICTED: HERV-H LTR-associating protein 1 [Hipposideros armiger]|uniref:HERV-H LTR-associating protein 1 n=1 Tax=Hipposideros armiger TaxID=186990 RepID=A0A8B7S1B1_HIPAR|nr:PREDICTED: HERV-H LTR-associating protein 1 [Hipposideros armiger]
MPGFLVHGPPGRLCMSLACVLSLWNTVSAIKEEAKKEKAITFLPTTVSGLGGEEKKEKRVAFLDTTELPARAVDLSELNLTELVNGMLSRALKDSKKFFSLLSITSYSSFAFHKLSVTIYNISNLKTVDPAKFPTRYCYCLNNRTNDLSDFTALLVDIIGNSTSYLTEIFKSTSILSVSQTNESDCIFICVMTGKSGRNLSDFWEMAEKSPVINYTFTSSLSGVLGESTRGTAGPSKLTPTSQETAPRTIPPRRAQSPGVSALRTSPWTDPAHPSEAGEQTMNMNRLPELHARTAAAPGRAIATLPALATRRVARTPWVTANRRAWASTLPGPWAQTIGEKTPGGPPWGILSFTSTLPAEAKEVMTTSGPTGPPARTAATHGSPSQTSPTSGTLTPGTQTPNPTKAPAPKYPQADDLLAAWPFTPGEEPALVPGPHQVQASRCPQRLLKEEAMTAAPLTVATQKLNPCLMELCRFFQQCLCMSQRRDVRIAAMRDCLEYYSWFLKNATYICQRVKRVSHSHTLKQTCLENICKSV